MLKMLSAATIVASGLIFPAAMAQQAGDTAPSTPELTLPLMNNDAWVFTPDVENEIVTHNLTGMICPFALPGGYELASIAQVARGGQTARCTYQAPDPYHFVSIAVTWIAKPQTAKSMSEHLFSVSAGGKATELNELSEARQVNFDGITASDCHRIEQGFASQGLEMHEKIETCQFGKWSYQLNQTAPKTDTSFTQIASALATVQGDMASNRSNCAAPTTAPIADIISNTGAARGDPLFNVLQSIFTLRAVAPDSIPKPQLSSSDCLIAYLEGGPNTYLITRDKSSDTLPISIIQTSLKGIEADRAVWVERAFGASTNGKATALGLSETYVLMAQSAPGVREIHRLYENAPPNDDQIVQDALDLFTGKLPVLATINEAPSGKRSWHR